MATVDDHDDEILAELAICHRFKAIHSLKSEAKEEDEKVVSSSSAEKLACCFKATYYLGEQK